MSLSQPNFKIISVFTEKEHGFKGNPSAVVELPSALNKGEMEQVAADFNQPATTFIWKHNDPGNWHVRWYAPDGEIGLCGHGSLAAIAYLQCDEIKLHYRDGVIEGKRLSNESCEMKITAINSMESQPSSIVAEGLGQQIVGYFSNSNKHIVLLESERELRQMKPGFAKLRESDVFGYIVTAPGDHVDFVSRTIVPHVQQLEDQATGSSHAALTPFWAARLDKTQMVAHQLSKRGGKFICELEGNWVRLAGNFSTIVQGQLNI